MNLSIITEGSSHKKCYECRDMLEKHEEVKEAVAFECSNLKRSQLNTERLKNMTKDDPKTKKAEDRPETPASSKRKSGASSGPPTPGGLILNRLSALLTPAPLETQTHQPKNRFEGHHAYRRSRSGTNTSLQSGNRRDSVQSGHASDERAKGHRRNSIATMSSGSTRASRPAPAPAIPEDDPAPPEDPAPPAGGVDEEHGPADDPEPVEEAGRARPPYPVDGTERRLKKPIPPK
ncbi:uncharacterized protein LTR77_005474 [Saxophila tyrrhenica]|uniref:Uncharacterized protein n=1 Tax=Saxophila tyrrhenica TaxID=1690608 RepID=A0AAV9P924_9PEZI|nr:hypothetical protein LTR77_005474 [Saxophila tyrrhenica]